MKERTQEDEILERAIEIAASRVKFYEDAHSEETRRRKSAEVKVAELEAENKQLRGVLRRDGDGYQALMSVSNGIDSPGLVSMALSAIRQWDAAFRSCA